MTKHEVKVIALTESVSKSGHYVLILEDLKTKKRIPMVVGNQEAQAIAIFMERLNPTRPLSHDLFRNIMLITQTAVKEAFIHKVEKEIFYCNILVKNSQNEVFELDARPSDAIALAIRFNCPIYVSDAVLTNTAYEVDEQARDKKGSYAEYSILELEQLLAKLLKKEDYESAVRIREAIERRRGKE